MCQVEIQVGHAHLVCHCDKWAQVWVIENFLGSLVYVGFWYHVILPFLRLNT